MLALGNGMIDNIKNITNLIPSIFTSIKNAFANSGWIDIGKNLIDGIIQGIKNAIPAMLETLKGAAGNALNAVKNFFWNKITV